MGRGGYGTVEFWDDYYVEDRPEPYDWFFPFEFIRPLIEYFIPRREERILMVGCGNSPFSESMRKAGYIDTVSVDNCQLVIDQQATRYPKVAWEVQDVRNMTYRDAEFDLVLDKGLLDNLLCYCDPEENTDAALRDMLRVLRPGGVYLLMSCHPEEEIRGIFARTPNAQSLSVDCLHLRNPRFPQVRVPAFTFLVVRKRGGPAVWAGEAIPCREEVEELTSPIDGELLCLSQEQVEEMKRRAGVLQEESKEKFRKLREQQQVEAAARAAEQAEVPSTYKPLHEQLAERRKSLTHRPPPPERPVVLPEETGQSSDQSNE